MIWAIALLTLGLAFVLAEVFFPSLGAFSVVAGACILSADVVAFGVSEAVGYVFIAAELVLIPLVIYTGFKTLPHTRFGREMLLQGPETAVGPAVPDYRSLIGQTGVALSTLRPAGTARFGEERISVVAQGPMLDVGTTVMVVSVEGPEVLVRLAPPSSQPATQNENEANERGSAAW